MHEAEQQKAAAAKAAQEEADEDAKEQADTVAKAQADAAAAAQAGEATRGQPPQLMTHLRVVASTLKASAVPPEGAGGDQPVMEREGAMASPQGQR